MENSQLGVTLRVREAGVEVVPPSRDAYRRCVVRPFRLWTLEDEVRKDGGSLIVRRGVACVGGLERGNESLRCSRIAKRGGEEDSSIVNADLKDAATVSAPSRRWP